MDSIRAGNLTGRDDLMNVQIAITRWRRPNANAFIGQSHMHGVSVGCRVNGDGLDAQFLTGSQHTKSNFATVGYEYFLKHYVCCPFLENAGGRICNSVLFDDDERFAEDRKSTRL